MPGSPQSDDLISSERPAPHALEERELEAALQLLVERAQYITGATGTALALPQGDEMVCCASAGACAPAVGARLQVRSGLTGESIARRQLLRCDNAETDPRVNLETCRALGIASIVVLPLLRRNGEVRGLFELFSDHPYAFEERDLVALERMAALTMTALDLAEQRHDAVIPARTVVRENKPAVSGAALVAPEPKLEPKIESPTPEPPPPEANVAAPVPMLATDVQSVTSGKAQPPEPPSIPEAMRRIQKCASCGFPVSQGRTLCLDCENLARLKMESERKASEKAAREIHAGAGATGGEAIATATVAEKATEVSPGKKVEVTEGEPNLTGSEDQTTGGLIPNDRAETASAALASDEILPPFLTNPQFVEESWLARHVNLLAFLVLVAAVLVAAVVFFR